MTTKESETFARAGALMIVGVILWAMNWWLHGRHIDPYATAQLETVERPDLR